MSLVITNGKVKIGAFSFPDRKKPCIAIDRGNTCVVYGHFIDEERANNFMNELATLVGAEEENEQK